LELPVPSIVIEPTLYLAPREQYPVLIQQLDNQKNTVAFFAHNPGITDFVNELTNVRIDNMPTCSIFAVAAETNNWAHFMEARKELLFFDYPKNK
jgi:phosphohistidine phosphatase